MLFGFELLQEAEARRSGRVTGSAVLGHAETLLAAMRHLITNESCAWARRWVSSSPSLPLATELEIADLLKHGPRDSSPVAPLEALASDQHRVLTFMLIRGYVGQCR